MHDTLWFAIKNTTRVIVIINDASFSTCLECRPVQQGIRRRRSFSVPGQSGHHYETRCHVGSGHRKGIVSKNSSEGQERPFAASSCLLQNIFIITFWLISSLLKIPHSSLGIRRGCMPINCRITFFPVKSFLSVKSRSIQTVTTVHT